MFASGLVALGTTLSAGCGRGPASDSGPKIAYPLLSLRWGSSVPAVESYRELYCARDGLIYMHDDRDAGALFDQGRGAGRVDVERCQRLLAQLPQRDAYFGNRLIDDGLLLRIGFLAKTGQWVHVHLREMATDDILELVRLVQGGLDPDARSAAKYLMAHLESWEGNPEHVAPTLEIQGPDWYVFKPAPRLEDRRLRQLPPGCSD